MCIRTLILHNSNQGHGNHGNIRKNIIRVVLVVDLRVKELYGMLLLLSEMNCFDKHSHTPVYDNIRGPDYTPGSHILPSGTVLIIHSYYTYSAAVRQNLSGRDIGQEFNGQVFGELCHKVMVLPIL